MFNVPKNSRCFSLSSFVTGIRPIYTYLANQGSFSQGYNWYFPQLGLKSSLTFLDSRLLDIKNILRMKKKYYKVLVVLLTLNVYNGLLCSKVFPFK